MASLDRLDMLEAQCRSYRGPLSAAIYLPLPTNGSAAQGPSYITNGAKTVITNRSSAARRAQREAQSAGSARTLSALRLRTTAQRSRRLHTMYGARGINSVGQVVDDAFAAGGKAVEAMHKEELARARAQLQALFDRMEATGRHYSDAAAAAVAASDAETDADSDDSCCCSLRLLLFAELTADRQLAALMPTNALRNAAMMAAQTPLVVMLDVDLGVSSNFSRLVADQDWIETVMDPTRTGKPALCILPAWEAAPRLDNSTAYRVTDAALKGSKQDVTALWDRGSLQVFHTDGCKACHGPIKHQQWAQRSEPYAVGFRRSFEPWGILRRLDDPGYDERFRGWCYDKMQHTEAMGRLLNFQLVVLPDAWVVHRPHARVALASLNAKRPSPGGAAGATQQQQQQQQPDGNRTEELDALLQVVQIKGGREVPAYKLYRAHVDSRMRAERALPDGGGQYDPQLNPQLSHCRSVLPWWRD